MFAIRSRAPRHAFNSVKRTGTSTSAHGTSRHFITLQNLVAIERSGHPAKPCQGKAATHRPTSLPRVAKNVPPPQAGGFFLKTIIGY